MSSGFAFGRCLDRLRRADDHFGVRGFDKLIGADPRLFAARIDEATQIVAGNQVKFAIRRLVPFNENLRRQFLSHAVSSVLLMQRLNYFLTVVDAGCAQALAFLLAFAWAAQLAVGEVFRLGGFDGIFDRLGAAFLAIIPNFVFAPLTAAIDTERVLVATIAPWL
jgi:hypothetical protein